MKKLILILLVTLSILSSQAKAAWPTVKAVRCWTNGTSVMKVQINPIGNGFFETSLVSTDNGVINNVGSGTAYLQGNKVYWEVINAKNTNDFMTSDISYIVLDKFSLSGQVWDISHYGYYRNGYSDPYVGSDYSSSPASLDLIKCSAVRW